jgi:hypothetical protein
MIPTFATPTLFGSVAPAIAWLGAVAVAGMVVVVTLVALAERRSVAPRVVIRLPHGLRRAA